MCRTLRSAQTGSLLPGYQLLVEESPVQPGKAPEGEPLPAEQSRREVTLCHDPHHGAREIGGFLSETRISQDESVEVEMGNLHLP